VGSGGRCFREFDDRRIDEAADLLQFVQRELSLSLQERRLGDCLGALLLDVLQNPLAATREFRADGFSAAMCLGDDRARFLGGVLAKLSSVFFGALAHRVCAFPRILEYALDVLPDGIYRGRLIRAFGALERCDPTVQFTQLADGGCKLSLSL
jgi:hypothetical protein